MPAEEKTRKPRPHPTQPVARKPKTIKPKETPKTVAAPSTKKSKRQHLTTYDWLNVFAFYDQHHKTMSQTEIANHFATLADGALPLTQPVLSKNLRKRNEIEARAKATPNGLDLKRDRIVTQPGIERALVEWVHQMGQKGEIVHDQTLLEKRRMFEERFDVPDDQRLKGTGWLKSFKTTYRIKQIKQHGEAGSCDMRSVEEERKRMQEITADYAPEDQWNMDETSLYWKLPPDRGLAQKEMSGRKASKNRISIAFTVSATGERENPLFIGKYKRPRCFKKKDGKHYGLYYRNNDKAWMQSRLFEEYLKDLDMKMRRQNRHILLTLDNFKGHAVTYVPTNIRVEFFAPNLTPFVQPLDAGIIRCFKAKYRSEYCRRALLLDDAGSLDIWDINILEAMLMAKDAWAAVSNETISNCWNHTKISDDPTAWIDDLPADSKAWEFLMMFAQDEFDNDGIIKALRDCLGDRYEKEGQWKKAVDLVFACDEPGEEYDPLEAIKEFRASCQSACSSDLGSSTTAQSEQIANLRTDLMDQVAELRTRRKISFEGVPTFEELVEPHEEKGSDPDHLERGDDEIVEMIKKGDEMDVEEEEEEEEQEPEMTTGEMLGLIERLEKACLTKGDVEEGFALQTALRNFRGSVRREEVLNAKQVPLTNFFTRIST